MTNNQTDSFEEEYEQRKLYQKLYNNMALFGRYCLGTATKLATPPFHSEIYDNLRSDDDRTLIAAPRGSSKSTLVSLVYPLWRIAFKKSNEELFIVIISESQTQSENFLARIKHHLMNSQVFIDLFGENGPGNARRWTNTDIVLKNGIRIIAVGTGQRVRGYIEGDTRPNLIIMDDIESEKNANTREARKKNRDWILDAVIPSGSDDVKVVYIGTVISEDCFLYWARRSGMWKTLWYQIINDEGESLWVEKFPLKRIRKIRKEFELNGNPNGFYQEYMNQAQNPDEAPFKPEWMETHQFDYEYIEGQSCMVRYRGEEKIVKPVNVYGGVDVASSLSSTADYFVIQSIGIDFEGVKYDIETFRGRISTDKQPHHIISRFKKYHHNKMKIETVAYQEALRVAVRELCREQGIHIPGIESGIKPRNSKSERLLSLVPMFARGQFKWRGDNLEGPAEFVSYPKGKNDDIMDAVWIALQNSRPCKHENIVAKGKKFKKVKKVLDWMTI